MAPPLVSVVISAYNRPEMFRVALESVLNQTIADIEIIVQDDSSNNECEQIVLGLNDNRIYYTHNRPRLGTAANLRAGYRKCKGKYISTLNDDDFYAQRYLESMASILEADAAVSMAFSDHFIVDASGTVLPDATDRNTQFWGRKELNEGIVPNCIYAALIKKSVPGMFAVYRSKVMDLSDFPDEVSFGYDYWMMYLGVRDGGTIYYCPERLTYYRVHSGNQGASLNLSSQLECVEYFSYMYRRLLGDERVACVWPDARNGLASMCATGGFAHLRLCERGKAMKQFIASLTTTPTRRAMAGIGLTLMPQLIFNRLDRGRQVAHRA